MEVKANHIRMFYQEHGQGVPVILIHGFPLDHSIWDPLILFVDARARVITPDLRGFGKSEVTQGVYTMRLLADDIAGLMDALQLPKAIIVGHSMGGYVSLAFAQAYPERLLGLGLVASQASADTPEKRISRYAEAESIGRLGVQPLADSMAVKLTGVLPLQEQLRALIMTVNPTAVIGALKGMAERIDMAPYLPSIEVPAAVVHGERDAIIPVEKARMVAEAIPRAVLTVFPDAFHMPMMEKPEQTAQALNKVAVEVASL